MTVAAGTKLPGVPKQTAYGELAWTPPAWPWLSAALEVQYVDQIYVNDRNSDSAPAYTVANLRVGVDAAFGKCTLVAGSCASTTSPTATYVGSVIVGDTNGRFFEPAPGRNWFVGATRRCPRSERAATPASRSRCTGWSPRW